MLKGFEELFTGCSNELYVGGKKAIDPVTSICNIHFLTFQQIPSKGCHCGQNLLPTGSDQNPTHGASVNQERNDRNW